MCVCGGGGGGAGIEEMGTLAAGIVSPSVLSESFVPLAITLPTRTFNSQQPTFSKIMCTMCFFYSFSFSFSFGS